MRHRLSGAALHCKAIDNRETDVQITISPEQVQLLRELVEPINLAHFNEECMPPGYSILIAFGGPFGNDAVAQCGNQSVDLGELVVNPAQDAWTLTNTARERG